MTPLEYLAVERTEGVDVWLLSAGGSNPDILAAWEGALNRRPAHIFVMCAQPDSPLANAVRGFANATLFDFSVPAGKDGFLATNSLLAFLVLLARLFGEDDASTSYLTEGAELNEKLGDRSLLVLYDPMLKPVAIDLESRFSETALGHVQVSDFRNFAHGRHVWLAKRPKTSAVLVLSAPATREMALATISLLPKEIPQEHWSFPTDSPAAVVDGVIGSMRFAQAASQRVGFNPGRPGVPEFGSKIYSLGPKGRPRDYDWRRLAIENKAGRSYSRLEKEGRLPRFVEALEQFVEELHRIEVRSLVLDFDGTLVNTRERFGPVSDRVIAQLIRLLEEGLEVGIATGRGQSVHKALVKRIPPSLQPQVTLGYYNAGVIRPLNEPPTGMTDAPIRTELERCEPALKADAEMRDWKRELRPTQITVEAGHVALRERELWFRVAELLARQGHTDLKVVHSSHSVDILPLDVTKVAVAALLKQRRGADCVQIGDRGLWPGNDAELLTLPNSLSVDEVSADLATCWNLLPAGLAGALGAVWYLKQLRNGRMGLSLP
jgi:HAD superfamily hydrolase (TIGR01484 family)